MEPFRMISSFRVSNFRQFEDLTVNGLRRLNLIVGENSVGKTSILETIWLHVNDGQFDAMRDVLALRGEIGSKGLHASNPGDIVRSPLSTFTPWPPKSDSSRLVWATDCLIEGQLHSRRYALDFSNYTSGIVAFETSNGQNPDLFTGLLGLNGDSRSFVPNKDWSNVQWDSTHISHDSATSDYRFQAKRGANVFVPAQGLDGEFVRDFWDKIALTEHEDDVDKAVQLLEAKVQRISLGSSGPRVKLKNSPAPVPLSRLGEGMSRLFALALAMVSAKDGVLLIDEIETGLHRSTLDRMWPFLFTLAHRFNVQLFATTHSWDCISSFAAAAKATQEDDGALVRLERKSGKVVAVVYDEATLASATEQGIEVR